MNNHEDNYYNILAIEPHVSMHEIKLAFRKKVKQYHPDLNQECEEIANMRMNQLIRAYTTLSNEELRMQYDALHYVTSRIHNSSQYRKSFSYRDFLKEQGDYQHLSKLIFYDLLHDNEHEAMILYIALTQVNAFSLDKYLEREDFLDCIFLLAEECEYRQEYLLAYQLLLLLVESELKKAYFHHFFSEILRMLKRIAGFKLRHVLPIEALLYCFDTLIELDISYTLTRFWYQRCIELAIHAQYNIHYIYDHIEKSHALYGNKQKFKKIIQLL